MNLNISLKKFSFRRILKIILETNYVNITIIGILVARIFTSMRTKLRTYTHINTISYLYSCILCIVHTHFSFV